MDTFNLAVHHWTAIGLNWTMCSVQPVHFPARRRRAHAYRHSKLSLVRPVKEAQRTGAPLTIECALHFHARPRCRANRASSSTPSPAPVDPVDQVRLSTSGGGHDHNQPITFPTTGGTLTILERPNSNYSETVMPKAPRSAPHILLDRARPTPQ
ncbi:hypothetical protein BKA93DRAFT_571102 [Sparassis latifolia]